MTEAAATFMPGLGRFLDAFEEPCLALGREARTLGWNEAFLRLFPEQAGLIHQQEPYAENLRRFYALRLSPAEAPHIEAYVADGVERHLRQQEPFDFLHRGGWLRSMVFDLPGGVRLRTWRPIHRPPDEGDVAAMMADAGRLPTLQAIEQLADGLALRGADGRLSMANSRFGEIYGLIPHTQVAGLTMPEVLERAWGGAAAAAAACRGWADNCRFQGASFDLPLPGDRRVRVREQRSLAGKLVGTHMDVTDIWRPQRRVEGLADSIRAVLEERRRAEAQALHLSRLASLGEMAKGLAHELNQPLCALALAADTAAHLLRAGGPHAIPAVLERLEEVASSAVHARGIVDELRRHGRADDALAPPEAVDMLEVVKAALTLTAAAIRREGIALELDLPAEAPIVSAHPLPMREMVMNLLLNARDAVRRHRRQGGSIRLRLERQGGLAVLTVADNGGGFTREALARGLEPFFTTKPVGEGTGIGLSISHATARAAGGTISLANDAEGAVASVRLPCQPAGAAQPAVE